MELDFEKIFEISFFAMRLNGSHPEIKRDIKWFTKFLIFHGEYTCLFLIAVYNILYINLKANNFTQTCKNGVLVVIFFAITFEYSVMLWKQEHMQLLINTVKRDYAFAKSQPIEEQKIIHQYAKMGRHVCKQWLVLTVVGTALFPLKNIAVNTWYWITTGEFVKIPMYDLVYPPLIEKHKENVLVFFIIFLVIFEYAVYTSVMYCAFVPLGPTLMLHACGQLEVVKIRIHKIFQSDDLDDVKLKLNGIVKQLQYIYDFVDTIKLCFTIAFEMTLKASAILLPVTCYEVLESLKHGEVSLEFIVFIIGGALFSSSPCFYGDLLMEKGEDVRQAMYTCGWEKQHDRAIRSTIVLVMERALRPVAIRTLFRNVCLDALTDTFQLSYSLFNLMNAAWN